MWTPRLASLVTLAVALGAFGCEKKSTLTVPGESVDGSSGAADAAGEVVLRYGAGARTLRQTASLETTTSGGGQFVEAKVEFRAKLAVSDQSGKLKVVWSVDAVDDVTVAGALQGKGQGDPKAFLVEVARGAYLTDLRGETDAAVNDTLPENLPMQERLAKVQAEVQAKTAAGGTPTYPAGADVLPFLRPVMQLPTLPEPGLTIGKATKIETEEERDLASEGVVLPLSIETTYTLVRVDTSGSARIAELHFSGRAGGEAEGKASITISADYEGTLLFDLDQNIPISYDVTRTETWNLGEITGETMTIISASWDPA